MRSSLLALLLVAVGCQSDDDSLGRFFAAYDAVDPADTVALAAQWYENENGVWPETLDDVGDLGDELGLSGLADQPRGMVAIPGPEQFRDLRFEVLSDTLLRLHFDLAPFEVEGYDGDDMLGTAPPRPAASVEESVGMLDVPAYRTDSGRRGRIERATVQTENGRMYSFENEPLDLQPVIFLKPVDS